MLFSCSPKGYWINGSCKPKSENYKILETPFKESSLIDNEFIYISEINYFADSSNQLDSIPYISAIGFKKNGKAFLNGYKYKSRYSENLEKNSFETGQEIGYYRIENDNIIFERFSCSDFGNYIRLEGKVKGDSIIFLEKNRKKIYTKSDLPNSIN